MKNFFLFDVLLAPMYRAGRAKRKEF